MDNVSDYELMDWRRRLAWNIFAFLVGVAAWYRSAPDWLCWVSLIGLTLCVLMLWVVWLLERRHKHNPVICSRRQPSADA